MVILSWYHCKSSGTFLKSLGLLLGHSTLVLTSQGLGSSLPWTLPVVGRGWSWRAGVRLVGLQRCKKSETALGTRTCICVCLTPLRSSLSESLQHGSWRKRRNCTSWSITLGPQVERPFRSLSLSYICPYCVDYVHTNSGLFILTGLPSKITADGLEITFATNHIGPFLLTSLLLGQTLHSQS